MAISPPPSSGGRLGGALAFLLLVTLVAAALFNPARAEAGGVKRLTAPVEVCPGQNSTGSAKRQLRAMRCMVNYARRKSGLRPLKSAGPLNRSASLKSTDIMRCGFDHSACGRDFTFWMRKVGYGSGCWAGGENIAWGQGKLGNPRNIFVAWLRSSGHRRNILSTSFNAFGVGLRKGRVEGHRDAQVWTTHFGRRC